MSDIDESFHRLTVLQRDGAWAQCERLQATLARLDHEATVLLNALYDATDTSDPDDLQAWFDARVGGTDERYDGMIARLRAVLRELHGGA